MQAKNDLIKKDELKALSKRVTYRSISNLIFNWSLAILLIYFCESNWTVYFYLPTIILLAARMHSISALSHEATHYLLTKNKTTNDIIAKLFITLPLFFSLKQYRRLHLAHHKHLWTEHDPEVQNHRTYEEFQLPLKKSKMFKILLLDIIGFNFFKYKFIEISSTKFWKNLVVSISIPVLIYYTLILSTLHYLGLIDIFFKYWVVAYLTWYQFIRRIRVISEHNAVPKNFTSGTRTTLTTLVDSLVIGPNNANFHAEHHLFPSVPFYNLPELHKILIKNEEFKKSTHFTKGYLNVIRESIL